MESEAHDFVIDANGNLVVFDDLIVPQDITVKVLDEGTVLAVVMQGAMGDIGVEVFGKPTKQLVAALQTAIQGLMTALNQQE
jgi:hypothetical protein